MTTDKATKITPRTVIGHTRRAAAAYRFARSFGRGRVVSAWLAARSLLTGSTGRFKVPAHVLHAHPRKAESQ